MHPKYPNGLSNVLEGLLAHIFEVEVEPVADLVADNRRYCDPAGWCRAFKPRSDIHPVAKNVVAFNDYVPEIDANPKLNLPLLQHAPVSRRHCLLHLDRTYNGTDDTWKFRQHAVPGCLEDSPLIFGDLGIDNLGPQGFQCSQGASLILAHKMAVADNIGCNNRRQPSLH